jgi:hypothetical protein
MSRLLCIRRITVSVVALLLSSGLSEASAQVPQVTVFLGKAEFFQSEPIYVVIEVSNPGPDTIWIPDPSLSQRWMRARLSRRDGTVVPERQWRITVIGPSDWRGDTLAPGSANYQSFTLQDGWGTPRSDPTALFLGDLAVGDYAFHAEFNLSLKGEPASVARSDEIHFTIRERTPTEDAEYEEVKAIRKLAWDRTTRTRYVPELVGWVERRLAVDSVDPYVPFLLNGGMQTAYAVGATWPHQEFRPRLLRLRLAAAGVHRNRPAGAVALSGGYAFDSGAMPAMPGTLVGTLAGAVGIQHDVKYKQHHFAGRGPRYQP